MRIVFGEMIVKNFMSYENLTFDWRTQEGITLITGKNNDIPGSTNGSGKTTTFSALHYALFGETQSDISKDNVCNMYTHGKETSVSQDIYIDGVKYNIISGRRGSKKKESFCTLRRFLEDGTVEDITKSTLDETYKYVSRHILKLTQEQFMHTVLLNTDPTYNFFKMKPAARKDYFESMFDIKCFSDMAKKVANKHDRVKTAFATEQATLNELLRVAEIYKEKDEEFEEERANKIMSTTSEYELAKKAYDDLNSEYEKLLAVDDRNNDATFQKMENYIRKSESTISDMVSELNRLNNTVNTNETIIKDKAKLVKKGRNLTSVLCKECSEKVAKRFKISEFEKEILEKNTTNDNLFKEIKKLDDEIRDKKEKLDKCREAFDKAKKKRILHQKVLSGKLNEVRNLERLMIEAKGRMDNAKSLENTFAKLRNDNKIRSENQTVTVEDLKKKFNVYKFCKKTMSSGGIERTAMERMVKSLNVEISRNLMLLGADYNVVITSDMDYHFSNAAVGTKPQYGNFSGGEQARITIATCLAFKNFLSSRNGVTTNLMLIDEYIDSYLDESAIKNIISLLRKHVDMFDQNVYIISHRSEVKSENFDHIIEVEKTNHISTLKIV